MFPLYSFGYAGKTPDELRTLAEQLDVLVADIRFSPRSRLPGWNGGRLAKLLGDRYRHLPALGNRNYKGGPVEIVDLEGGAAQVADLWAERPVILLCACSDLNAVIAVWSLKLSLPNATYQSSISEAWPICLPPQGVDRCRLSILPSGPETSLERLKMFYETYFAAQAGPKYVNPAKQYESYFLRFDSGARLELMFRPDIPSIQADPVTQFTGYIHLAIAVGSEMGVDELTRRLQADGYPVLDGPRRTGDGYYESVVLDPEGNRIEITA